MIDIREDNEVYSAISSARKHVNSFGVSCYQDAQTMAAYNDAVKELGELIARNNEANHGRISYAPCESCGCEHERVLACPNCGR
jgi:hypothetical protein